MMWAWGAATMLVVIVILSERADAQATPSLRATQQGAVVVRVLSGQNASVEYQNPVTGATYNTTLITFEDLLQERTLRVEDVGQLVNQVSGNIRQDTSANFTALSRQISSIQSAQTSLAAAISASQLRAQTLAVAIDEIRQEIPTNISCPPFGSVANWAVLGHGRAPGATLVVRCNTGFSLSGSGSVVVCQFDGTWSDTVLNLQCVSSTAAPTAAPTPPPELVTCCARDSRRSTLTG
eukprot:m.108620 g.108620  ORF g.108620 m.108620 type:complete len:237 (+) comp12813_c0_seq2:104-814(+)